MILHTGYLQIGFKNKNETKILHELNNVTVQEGKVIALLGANGIGKTTLLKTITGLVNPLMGDCLIGDRKISALSISERAEKIALVLTEKTDTGNLDVFSLVALGRIPYLGIQSRLSDADLESVEHVLKITELESFAFRLVNSLSDGERQRVMIARAIAQNTALVLLDEPTAFLDVLYKKKIMEMIRFNASSTNRSFILSTHDIHLAFEFADELWVIPSDGKLRVINKGQSTVDEITRLIIS